MVFIWRVIFVGFLGIVGFYWRFKGVDYIVLGFGFVVVVFGVVCYLYRWNFRLEFIIFCGCWEYRFRVLG